MTAMPKRDYTEPDFRVVFEAAPTPYLVLDPSFTIIAVNDALLRATNTKRADVIGQHLFAVFPDDPDNRSGEGVRTVRDSLVRVLQTRMPDRLHGLKYSIGLERQDATGYEAHVWEVVNIPILGEDGFVRWILNSPRDITEVVALEARLRDAGSISSNPKV